MLEYSLDTLLELLVLLTMALGVLVFTGLGLLGEQAGLTDLLAGQLALGSWELFIGTWALFVGIYLLGFKQVLPRATTLLSG